MPKLSLSEIETFDSKGIGYGKQKRYLCPLCGVNKLKDTAHRSLAVNSENGLYYCHRCQVKGCLTEFWETPPILSRRIRTKNKLSAQFSVETRKTRSFEKERSEKPEQLDNLFRKMLQYQSEFIHSPAEIYLLSRGILTDTAVKGGCGYAENWEHWSKNEERWVLQGSDRRVVFPIYDQSGSLVAIHGRAIDDKYYNSPKITRGDKSLGLFLSDKNVLKNKNFAICEGALDAMALETLGTSAVAMTGTTPPEWFYRKAIFKKVLIATDSDDAGEKSAQTIRYNLQKRCAEFERYAPPEGKDWSEYLENRLNKEI